MNMLKISKAIFRSLLSSRSLCVAVVALMVLCALPVFRSAAGIDGRVEYLESGITRVEQELSASYADALVNAGEEGVYTSSSSMPALLYPLAAGRLVLAPLSPLLPFLQVSDGAYSFYDGSKEYLLWAATAVAVSFLAARLNKREKLIIQAPMGELGRLVASSVWASVFAMLAVLAVNLPGIIAALVKNGPGSLFYPIGYVQYATPVIKPAWLVFAQTAILQFLVAAFISLVVHLAVKIANNPTLGIVFVCALMGATMVPGYYGRSIALREFALLNPLTYANTELTVGAYSPYPTTQIVNLPGLCFERGAITLVCAIGIEVLAISLLCVAGKSGCARPMSPICLERGSFTASRTTARSSACASAVAYVRTMGKLLLHSPALAVCAIAMSTAMLAPALVEVFPDAGDVSAVRYRDGELRSIDRYLEQDAANMDVEGKAALEGMRDALSGFVYAPTPAEGFRSLATYERARGELGAANVTLLQSIGIEPETPSRVEARALLLESIASLPDPKVYELSTKMPPLILLSYLQAALPSLFWLLPVVVTSLACTHLRCRSLLVFQVPATAHVRFLTAVALSLLLGLALLLVSMVPAAVVSLIKNGAGGSEYPVALIRAGASTTSMVGEAVLCSIPLLVMAYGVISVVAALTAAISRNPVVTGVVCAVLLVLGSLSAHVESAGMGVALLAPFASFDPASQVGTIGFLGRGTNAMPFGEVVGASGALLVVLGVVSPLMVRLSVPKIERG